LCWWTQLSNVSGIPSALLLSWNADDGSLSTTGCDESRDRFESGLDVMNWTHHVMHRTQLKSMNVEPFHRFHVAS
jgi:hypothetical protein